MQWILLGLKIYSYIFIHNLKERFFLYFFQPLFLNNLIPFICVNQLPGYYIDNGVYEKERKLGKHSISGLKRPKLKH